MFIEPETKSVKLAARYDVSLGEYIICRTRNVGLQNSDYIGGIRCVGHPPRAPACGRGRRVRLWPLRGRRSRFAYLHFPPSLALLGVT